MKKFLIAVAVFLWPVLGLAQSTKATTELPVATSISISDEVVINQGGATKRGSVSLLRMDTAGWGLATRYWVSNSAPINATNLLSGTIPSARYGAASIDISKINAGGTADNTTFLRGDGSWSTPAGGSGGSATEQTLVDGATITWDYANGSYATVTLGGNRTLSLTNASTPSSGILEVVQDGTGSRTLTLPGISPPGYALSTGSGQHDLLGFTKKSSGIYWTIENYGTTGADVTAPTLISATVENASPTHVDLVFNEAMNSTWSASSAFTVAGHTVSAITRVTSTTGYLTVDAFSASETRTLAYTQPGSNKMQDLAGNLLANISSTSITDNVSGGGSGGIAALDFTGSTGIIALGSDGDDWQVSGSGGYGNLGKATKHRPSGGQARIIMDNIPSTGSHASVLGFCITNAEVGYVSMISGISIDKNTSTVYPVDGGVIGSGISLGSAKSVCVLVEAAGVFKIQTSTQVAGGPYTWTTIATLSSSSSAALYPVGDMNGTGGTFINAYGEDLVP